MAMDLYSPCPCGSGKKFKWCCQPIHVQIEKAIQHDADGQHEVAIRAMEELVKEHPENPEARGRQAQLLYQNGRQDDAENALQKALEINPNYPFGHLLRGLFRQEEGEITGALLLFRKASDLYDPDAKDIMAQVHSLIAESEMRLNRPLAAHASLRICSRLRPSQELAENMENVFGPKSHLHPSARRDYKFMAAGASMPADQKTAWEKALAGAGSGKLTDAAYAFEQIAAAHPDNAAAWYNLGLVRAWLGDNAKSIEALDRYVGLENDERLAGAAWTLAEVLRFGQGMEETADYVEHSSIFQVRDPQRLVALLQEWQTERRLTGVQVNQEQGAISGVMLDRSGVIAGVASTKPASLGCYLMVVGSMLVFRGTNREAIDRARQELQQRAGPIVSEPRTARGPANFGDVLAEAVVFPIGATSQEEAEKQVREHVQRYFEEVWIHRPLRSLSNATPIDAAGSGTLRKKVLGLVQFLEEAATGHSHAYDFGRLRNKLGLSDVSHAGAPAQSSTPAMDIGAMNAAQLAGLKSDSLSDEQVEQAYRVAQQLDAHELAGHFATSLLSRKPQAGKTDRFPIYNYLVQRSLSDGNTASALDHVNEGEKADCEHNEGQRRNDFELRRGQILVKRGEADAATDVFERLIARVPDEMRYRATAAESMLAIKKGSLALKFAEEGLAKARAANNRDSENHFMELVGAARKQVG